MESFTALVLANLVHSYDHGGMKQISPLRARRLALKLSLKKVGELAGDVPHQTIEKLEKGERKLTKEWAVRLAPALRCDPQDLLFPEEGERQVQVLGLVGAGAAMILYSEGDPPDDWVTAPDNATHKTVALEIRGDSMGSLLNGWLLFYDDRRDPVTEDLIGRVCVAGLKDGRVLVKQIKAGGRKGFYTLHSSYAEPIYDVALDWAAEVKGFLPRSRTRR